MSRKITCSIPFMECDFIFWPQSCVYTRSKLHGWVITGWFWDMQEGKGRLWPRSWKSNKSCLSSLKMSHSFDKLKNDIFIALIIGSAQAAEMTIWVVCVQAVFRRTPRCTAWLAVDTSACPTLLPFVIVCFVIVIVFLELFGPRFWISAMISF